MKPDMADEKCEAQLPDSQRLFLDDSPADLTKICWTQLLRAEQPEGPENVQPLSLSPPPDASAIEKLFE
jgi:hypothetical protein